MDVLFAPGRFRGTTGPEAAAQALAAGWSSRSPVPVTTRPMSDGAADLVEVVAAARPGRIEALTVPGPFGEPVAASVLLLDGGSTAVVEAAQAVGEHLVAPRDRARAAMAGGSHGVGVLVRAALEAGACRVVVGVGQGAVHDAGLGLLEALAGRPTAGGGGPVRSLDDAGAWDLGALREVEEVLRGRDVVVACAVDTPLLGLHGAGAGLSARTGMSAADAQERERMVGAWADLMERWSDARPAPGALALAGQPDRRAHRWASRPRSGAGGGVAFALGLAGARLVDGAAMVADLVDLEAAVERSGLVVTGGATLDAPALHSGVVAGVGAVARRHAVPAVVVAPRVEVSRRELAGIGVTGAYATDPEPGPFAAPRDAAPSDLDGLVRLGARIASTWAPRTR